MQKIESPTLHHIAECSLKNGIVEIVIDDIRGNYHYLMSEQREWEKGRVPNLGKEVLSLPVKDFFTEKNGDFYDITNTKFLGNIPTQKVA